jgi:hypothetical protein
VGSDAQLAIDFDAAVLRREQGMQSASDHANEVESEWTGQALALLVAFALDVGRPFLVEEARAYAQNKGLPPPPDARAWGTVTRRAVAKKRIEKAGAAAAASSNCSLKVLWIASSHARL